MKKILVVDDDADMLESVQSTLVKEGYETYTLLEWEKVYRKVREVNPDLIILDAYLDGVDGRIICRNLKNDKGTKHLPVIMYSAHATAANAVPKYGADAFMAKPFQFDQLLNLVNQYVGKETE